jgi:hypothetical protein
LKAPWGMELHSFSCCQKSSSAIVGYHATLYPSPLPWDPTASQVIPVWRGFQSDHRLQSPPPSAFSPARSSTALWCTHTLQALARTHRLLQPPLIPVHQWQTFVLPLCPSCPLWLKGFLVLVLAECCFLMRHGAAYLSFSPQGELNFLFLGEVRPFCILSQTHPANKARNRPCSISRAERKADWPKFFVTFRKYTCPRPLKMRRSPVDGRRIIRCHGQESIAALTTLVLECERDRGGVKS